MSLFFFITISLSNLSHLEQSGRRGKVTWGEIKTDPESLIAPRFLLKAKLGNPTRMSLKDLTAYWDHWASKDKKGDPFSFSLDGNSDKASSNAVDEDVAEEPTAVTPDHHSVDDDIPFPFLCKTPSTRTDCLQKLVPNRGEINKTFHTLVEMVDTLEVSSMSNI